VAVSSAEELSQTGSWTEFRNGGQSTATGSYPKEWSQSKGIAWEQELIGYGQSTPVILDGKVYVTSVQGPMKEACRIVCYDINSGKELWSEQLDAVTKSESNYMHSRAAPTPLIDDRGVYAFFEGGNLAALKHDGSTLWERDLNKKYGPFKNNHGLGGSPSQSAGLIFLNLEHSGPSCLLAIDKQTGKTRWKVERPSGNSWTSPIVIQGEESSSVVVSSAGAVTAYDATSGKELWSVDGLEGNSVLSPTYDGLHLLIGARLPEFGSNSIASKSNLCLQLKSGQFEVQWRAKKVFSDYASPVVADDCVYYLSKAGILSCLDLETGDSHYMKRLGVECWATPLVADGHVYFFGKKGETVVIRSGRTFEKVVENQLWDVSNPPKPETYVEHQGKHGHGASGHGATGEHGAAATGKDGASDKHDSGGGSGGMLGMLLRGDKNKDGILTKEEVPDQFQPMFPRVDLNKDGSLDAEELKAMAESFRKRREGSLEGARDPIVYGIAAANGTIVVRTGTRLYAIREAEMKP